MLNVIASSFISIVPFVVAWGWLGDKKYHQSLLRCIAICAIFYSFLALIEMRLSPQLNQWIYGYFPHNFIQHVRGGQFRPLVFLSHGLELAFFLLTAALAALGLARSLDMVEQKLLYIVSGLWILLVLLISPNLGAAILAVVFVPIVIFFPKRIQIVASVIVAVLFLSYPAGRQYMPLEGFVNFISSFSPDRAESFQFRLDNEKQMLTRAFEKPFFGWGGWGRWRVYDENGQDVTTADGIWIIFLGERGLVGFLAYFGIFTLPLFALARSHSKLKICPATTTLAVLLACNLLYMIPNSTLSPLGWLISGAIAGHIGRKTDGVVSSPKQVNRREVRYSRFPVER